MSTADQTTFTLAVAGAKFTCLQCDATFHGKCGKVGQVNPKRATVTCPKCKQMQKLDLPFKVLKEKPKDSTGDYFEAFDPLSQQEED